MPGRTIMIGRAAWFSHSREGAWHREHVNRLLGTGVLTATMMSPQAMGQHSGHQGYGSLAHHASGRVYGGGTGGGMIGSGRGIGGGVGGWGFGGWLPYYAIGFPGGMFTFVPPMFPMWPGGMGPMMGPQPLGFDRGPIAAPPPAGMVDPAPADRAANNVGQKPKAKDSTRSRQLVLMGDRLFRGNNVKKAEERYLQATRLDPSSAAPLVGLAQVALVRVQYAEAARRLREAETAQPGWIVTAPDVQSSYGEPGDFARHLSHLESHLQVHPDDRDAWLVLGAEWYLSGRTARRPMSSFGSTIPGASRILLFPLFCTPRIRSKSDPPPAERDGEIEAIK